MAAKRFQLRISAILVAMCVGLGAFNSVAAMPPIPEATTGAAPLWVDDPRLQFPRTDYLSRRGRGDSAQAAAQDAYQKIVHLYRIAEGQRLPEAIENALTVAAIWHDSANQQYRAIITLRQKAAENYLRTKISELDSQTESALQAAARAADPFTQLGLISKALHDQKTRAGYQSAMKKVDVTARGVPAKRDIDALKKMQEEQLTSLRIHPVGAASDVPLDVMSNMISRGLKVANIVPVAKAQADYLLKGHLSVSHAPDESGWMGGQGVLTLSLTKVGADAIINSHQWDINVIHLYPETAERRVVEKAEYLLKREMRQVLIDMAMQLP